MATGQKVGYKRVSTADQNTARQLEGIEELDEVFEDKASGKDARRPALEALLKHVRKGDTVFVHSMDRLARNLADLLETVEKLTGKGVCLRFIKENLKFAPDSSDPMATLMLQMIGAFAQFERSLILERQREGIAIAKAEGRYKGRPKGPENPKADEVRRRVAAGERVTDVARDLGISRQSAYTWAKAGE